MYIYGIIIALIVLPIMKPWYMFALDHVMSFHGWIPELWNNIFWVGYLSQIFVFLWIPIWVMEKLLILMTFIAPAGWIYLLTKSIKNNYAITFAGLLILFNPFLYGRFLDGQINIYLSYALYPLFFYLLKVNLENKISIKNIAYISGISLLLCLTSLHNAIFIWCIWIVFWLYYLSKKNIKNIILVMLSIWVINLSWFVPFILSDNSNSSTGLVHQIDNFNIDHRNAFKTLSGEKNLYFNTLSLNGYWWENQKRFVNDSSLNTKSHRLFGVLFIIILLWIYYRYKTNKLWRFEYSLLSLWIISYIFALGISENNIFSSINQWMYNYFPFYNGMREPHKWSMFLVIIYAYFGAYGIKYIYKKIKKSPLEKWLQKLVLIIIVSLVFWYTPRMILGWYGQVSIQDYPKQWKQVQDELLIENDNFDNNNCEYSLNWTSWNCYNSLVFPWHSYMHINFTKKLTLGSITRYLGDNILGADNIEIWSLYTASNRSESKIIEKYIGPNWVLKIEEIQSEDVTSFIWEIKKLWIQNIIVLHEVDYDWYQNILEIAKENNLLEIRIQNDMITVYNIVEKQWK